MGGINHQPCNHYQKESVRLSRNMSLARRTFEDANIALEEAILAELDKQTGTLEPVVLNLQLSDQHLAGMDSVLRDLRAHMNARGYTDLSSIRKYDFASIGEVLVENDFVSAGAWTTIHAHMSTANGFYSVIDHFTQRIETLREMTRALCSQIQLCQACVESGAEINQIVEQNGSGNFKIEFAATYHAWNEFQAEFLASAIYSTEAWYRQAGHASLILRYGVAHVL